MYLLHALLTSALDGGEWLASRPSLFTRQMVKRLGVSQGRSKRCGEEKILPCRKQNHRIKNSDAMILERQGSNLDSQGAYLDSGWISDSRVGK